MDASWPEILETTDEVLSVSKPSGWHTVAGASSERCVELWLKEKGFTDAQASVSSSIPDSGILYRLDELTSGLLLVARTPIAYERLVGLFRDSETGPSAQKFYLARVEGNAKHEALATGAFELNFESRYRGSKKMTVSVPGPRSSSKKIGRCRWRVLSFDRDFATSLLEVELIGAGKRHQIRAGLAHLSHPICGDQLYGARARDFFGLHCAKIVLEGREWRAPQPAWAATAI